MLVSEFIAKWKKVDLKERSAAQEHFIDLCRVVGHPTPAQADPTGASYCFERGAAKYGEGDGFADVWKKGFFGWEYKGKHKDLDVAYGQLLKYRDALANPPLLVVCDMDRIVLHTNFTNTVSEERTILLDDLSEPSSLDILRSIFFEPEKLRPGQTIQAITQEAARHFADIAESMRRQGIESTTVARFLDRVVFCLFAEDIGLLPELIFSRLVEKSDGKPSRFSGFLRQLFEAMRVGGEFGLETILHFNGNLFDDSSVPELTADQVKRIAEATRLDWSAIDPSIFGTLFERGLDPSKRSQLGAHFTSREDIEVIVDVVVVQPMRQEWDAIRQTVEALLTTGRRPGSSKKPASEAKAKSEAAIVVGKFLSRLRSVRVLDPACGSGNFLYVALQKLMDLEKNIATFAYESGLPPSIPRVSPLQLYGIEVNQYAYHLAQMTVWIGWIQWLHANGFGFPDPPILRRMDENFLCQDAILDLSDTANPKEPAWPKVDFIIGNPPFLGDKLMRRDLGDDYVDKLRSSFEGRIPGQSDLCCYWFEKARAHIASGGCNRAGLLATQGIRGGANREVLKRIQETGGIFWAISDRDWILDGATVHVSMVAFDNGAEAGRSLDGVELGSINSNLSGSEGDTTKAKGLPANRNIGFIGVAQKAPFDLDDGTARHWLSEPNPNGRPNSDVLRPIINAMDLTRRRRWTWNVDFGLDMPQDAAAMYCAPFEHVRATIRPLRLDHREPRQSRYWWLFARPCPDMREALAVVPRYLATPRVSKHRLFVWLTPEFLCDSAVVAFARPDDCFFGIVQSRLHTAWALAQGTQLREKESGFRYTPTSCFATFPFPTPTPEQKAAIAGAAKELNGLRERWLNPPEWTREEVLEFPGTVGGPWDRYIDKTTVDGKTGIGLVRYPRLVPKDQASADQLQKRTLTQLYNARPAWLETTHRNLDAAVFAAYGWQPDISDDDLLGRLLELNLSRAALSGT